MFQKLKSVNKTTWSLIIEDAVVLFVIMCLYTTISGRFNVWWLFVPILIVLLVVKIKQQRKDEEDARNHSADRELSGD